MGIFSYGLCIAKDVTGPRAAYADEFRLSVCYPRAEVTETARGVHQLQMDVNSFADTESLVEF